MLHEKVDSIVFTVGLFRKVQRKNKVNHFHLLTCDIEKTTILALSHQVLQKSVEMSLDDKRNVTNVKDIIRLIMFVYC